MPHTTRLYAIGTAVTVVSNRALRVRVLGLAKPGSIVRTLALRLVSALDRAVGRELARVDNPRRSGEASMTFALATTNAPSMEIAAKTIGQHAYQALRLMLRQQAQQQPRLFALPRSPSTLETVSAMRCTIRQTAILTEAIAVQTPALHLQTAGQLCTRVWTPPRRTTIPAQAVPAHWLNSVTVNVSGSASGHSIQPFAGGTEVTVAAPLATVRVSTT